MKAKAIIPGLIIIMTIMSTSAFGAFWKVDNTGGVETDFTTLQAAHDDDRVQPGDTFYVSGSPTSYGDLTLTKQLTIIGPGYLLNNNPNTQFGNEPATVHDPTFSTGSEGSVMTGMKVYDGLDINCNNITVKNNYITAGNNYDCFYLNASNSVITQNYIYGRITGNGYNIIISNNYIRFSDLGPAGSYTISNNIFSDWVTINNAEFYNNIMTYGVFSSTSSTINNNIGHSGQFGTENGNQSNVDMSTVFVETYSIDKIEHFDDIWQLQGGSPAIGAGVGGVDCGMFGGVAPYRLSGIPSIPSIYAIDGPVTGSAASGLPIQVKIRSN